MKNILINPLQRQMEKNVEVQKQKEMEMKLQQARSINEDALLQLEEVNYSMTKVYAYPSTKNGLRMLRLVIDTSKFKTKILLHVDQNVLNYFIPFMEGKFPEEVKLQGNEDYQANENEDFGFSLFKMFDEAHYRFSMKEDWISPKGDHYLKAVVYCKRGTINFSIKRTPDVETYLNTNGFVLKRTFNTPEEQAERKARVQKEVENLIPEIQQVPEQNP